jgi:hypothetical protein
MATLTVNFTTSLNAVKYRVKYRKTGTSSYTTINVTTSPATINADCGSDYEGTVEAICVEGIPCNSYQISSINANSDGDIEYTDCATGNTVTQAVLGITTFYVCSRTTPIALNVNVTINNMGATQSCAQSSPINEEASGPVYWTAPAVACPPAQTTYYWTVTPCQVGAPIPLDSNVRTTDASFGIGNVVKLVGAAYVNYCYTITDISPDTFGVLINDAEGAFISCASCEASL